MLIQNYKDPILELLALTFVVGAATIGSVAGQRSSETLAVEDKGFNRNLSQIPPRTPKTSSSSELSSPKGALERRREKISGQEGLKTVLYKSSNPGSTEYAAASGGPPLEVLTMEPGRACRIYTAWCDAEQVLLTINARKEGGHPSAPSPIP